MVSYLAISPQKYPEIGTQEKEKCQGICNTVFQNYVVFFSLSFDFIFHTFKCINQTFYQNRQCRWDKTGEGNVVLDYAISAHKYPEIVTQEKDKFKESPTVFFKSFFYEVLTSFFTCSDAQIRPSTKKKKCLDKTGIGIMVLDYAISAQKYPKIVLQEKE